MGEIFRVKDWDVDVFLADMLNVYLALLIVDLVLNHSEGDVAPDDDLSVILTQF